MVPRQCLPRILVGICLQGRIVVRLTRTVAIIVLANEPEYMTHIGLTLRRANISSSCSAKN
jgi:hypothetical protein